MPRLAGYRILYSLLEHTKYLQAGALVHLRWISSHERRTGPV